MGFKKIRPHKKVCIFDKGKNKLHKIDYKNVDFFYENGFITPNGKIAARHATGTCAKHQRELARAIKNARYMGLLPYNKD